MPTTIVVGTQWGDKGKGKFTALIAKEMDVVVRYQGGHNAGHILVIDGETFALQLVPSGILYGHIMPVIGNGVVVDPQVLIAEIDMLEAKGVDCSALKVSGSAHLIMPHHQQLDALHERHLGHAKLGTTKRASARPMPTRPCGSGCGCRICSTPRSSARSSIRRCVTSGSARAPRTPAPTGRSTTDDIQGTKATLNGSRALYLRFCNYSNAT